jgi:hypothetical protein
MMTSLDLLRYLESGANALGKSVSGRIRSFMGKFYGKLHPNRRAAFGR